MLHIQLGLLQRCCRSLGYIAQLSALRMKMRIEVRKEPA
jgi:hypothetical protein